MHGNSVPLTGESLMLLVHFCDTRGEDLFIGLLMPPGCCVQQLEVCRWLSLRMEAMLES